MIAILLLLKQFKIYIKVQYIIYIIYIYTYHIQISFIRFIKYFPSAMAIVLKLIWYFLCT